MRRAAVSVLLALMLSSLAGAEVPEAYAPLSERALSALLRRPCALVYVWSSDCGPCLGELPDLLRTLAALPAVAPVVLDVTPGDDHDFARGLAAALMNPFPLYYPEGDRNALTRRLGLMQALPWAILYARGHRRKEWSGGVDLGRLGDDVAAHCVAPPQKLK